MDKARPLSGHHCPMPGAARSHCLGDFILPTYYLRSCILSAPCCTGRRLGQRVATYECIGCSSKPWSPAIALTSRHSRKAPNARTIQRNFSGLTAHTGDTLATAGSRLYVYKIQISSGRRGVVAVEASVSGDTGSKGNTSSSSAASNSSKSHKADSPGSGGLGASGNGNAGRTSTSSSNNGGPAIDGSPSPGTTAASAAVAASVAAAAVAGAVASAAPPPTPRATPLGLLQRVVVLLRANFVAVLMLYAIKDAVAFLLHRVTQRLTNHAAEVLLGTPTSATGNPWWLILDPAFIRAHPGYELLIGLFFLACLPFTIALNSLAFTITTLICTPERQRTESVGVNAAAAAAAASRTVPSSSSPWWRLPSTSAAPGPQTFSDSSLPSNRQGVGGSLYLPPDDPAAAALADLGIHALPTASPPSLSHPSPSSSSSSSSSSTSTPPTVSNQAGGIFASITPPTAATTIANPMFDEPPPSMSTISAATSLAAGPLQLPSESEAAETGATTSKDGPWGALRAAAASVAAVFPEACRAFRRVWWVDLQFNVRALPLQGLCFLILPAIWAVPRLMRIQLALPVAVLESRSGRDALDRSSNVMTSSLGAYGWPFAMLLAAGRLLEYVQGLVLVLIPPRWWREVVEVPLLIAGGFLLLKASIQRLQDLLPLAAYLELSQQEADAARKLQNEVLFLHSQPDSGAGTDRPQAPCDEQQSGKELEQQQRAHVGRIETRGGQPEAREGTALTGTTAGVSAS